MEPEQDSAADGGARLHVMGGQAPVTPSSVTLPPQPYAGGRARTARAAGAAPLARFNDVESRARRLVEWAHEESEYLRTHDVGLFSPNDVMGRTGFADEGLYELLPALHADAMRLRAACGRGPLWAATWALCEQAAEAVQSYYELWQRLRDQHHG